MKGSVYAVQIEPKEEQLVVSSSSDRSACIWDRRKLGPGVKALHSATANNVILSAYFSADGAASHHCTERVILGRHTSSVCVNSTA